MLFVENTVRHRPASKQIQNQAGKITLSVEYVKYCASIRRSNDMSKKSLIRDVNRVVVNIVQLDTVRMINLSHEQNLPGGKEGQQL